jgi:hypothetical protein
MKNIFWKSNNMNQFYRNKKTIKEQIQSLEWFFHPKRK